MSINKGTSYVGENLSVKIDNDYHCEKCLTQGITLVIRDNQSNCSLDLCLPCIKEMGDNFTGSTDIKPAK